MKRNTRRPSLASIEKEAGDVLQALRTQNLTSESCALAITLSRWLRKEIGHLELRQASAHFAKALGKSS